MRMPESRTLLDIISDRCRSEPDGIAFVFGREEFSCRRMWRSIRRFAGQLAARGLNRGDRVLIVLPNGPEFFAAFYGTIMAGGISVPIFPDSGWKRIESIAGLCRAAAIVVPSESGFMDPGMRRESGDPRVVSPIESRDFSADADFPDLHSPDVAFIQYTSGSTGDPKGVLLTHAGLITNIRQMKTGMRISGRDVFVSWLPSHHDMGLILMTMLPFCYGIKLVLIPSSLVNIREWIGAIQKHRGTFTAAPDFAYRLALAYIKNPRACDLSSLRVALNAAEPVRAETVRRFEEAFGLPHVMLPAYGLAEATVGVSSWTPGSPVKVDAHGHVAVGRGFPGVEMRILSGSKWAGPGTIGEILVKSPANTRGYLNNPEATRRLFYRDSYIRTGDLGYRDHEGDVFVTGRKKNIIIQAGRNISPREVEEIVDDLPFVRIAAALGIDRGHVDGEQVYIFSEIRAREGTPDPDLRAMVMEIVNAVRERLGTRPGRVYLMKPRAVPRTSNGKIRYETLREEYSNGSLLEDGKIIYPRY